jgi:hypothetical protein
MLEEWIRPMRPAPKTATFFINFPEIKDEKNPELGDDKLNYTAIFDIRKYFSKIFKNRISLQGKPL